VHKLRALFRNDRGQDLIEYTLLLAFVSLVVAGVFVNTAGGIGNIWNSGNATLTAGADAANGNTPAAGDPGAPPADPPASPPASPPDNSGGHPGDGDHDGHHDHR
jgi:Flp pilus assembly pilin Flp